MAQSGRVTFGAMEAVVLLMVSGTLDRTTGEIAKVHRFEGSSARIC